MHDGHIGGLLNSTAAAFPTAKVYIDQTEYAYWKNLSDSGDPSASTQGVVLSAYGNRVVPFAANGTEVDHTGVVAIPAYGHTPGHAMYLVQDLLYWGDVTHAMAIQMPVPRVAVTYDVDPQQAVAARLQVLEKVLQNRWKVAGAHIPWPAIGTLEKSGNGYAFTPVPTETAGQAQWK
jgi:glyoxylase-like metal-dependent hydrolase (beta-lactamase superfamily II)